MIASESNVGTGKRPHVGHCKFTAKEDDDLRQLVNKFGPNNWTIISNALGNRTPRQCRDRWNNYLSPSANLTEWTHEEDLILMSLYRELGSKWSIISSYFNGRTTASIRAHALKLERQCNKLAEEKKTAKPVIVTTKQPTYFMCTENHNPAPKVVLPNILTIIKQMNDFGAKILV